LHAAVLSVLRRGAGFERPAAGAAEFGAAEVSGSGGGGWWVGRKEGLFFSEEKIQKTFESAARRVLNSRQWLS
jgi:hypothetical protein